MVPGYTDSEIAMDQLAKLIVNYQTIVDKIEILPYHKMGVQKYDQLGIEDPLKAIPQMDKAHAKELQSYLIACVKDLRNAELDQAASA